MSASTTQSVVRKQLCAMAGELFEIGVLRMDGRMLLRSGWSADEIKNAQVNHLKAGDMIVIPAGSGHLFTEIPDHITYMMVRIDPDKVVPTKSEAESQADLKVVPPPAQGKK